MKIITPQGLAALLKKSRKAVALTGAGISVESGIPDFRSPGGLWERFDPMEYAHIRAFRRNPAKVWPCSRKWTQIITRARPNPAHYALAELEARGCFWGIITQNVDNLHQAAGANGWWSTTATPCASSANCRGHHPRESLDFSHPPLYCLCGGLIRPDVVFFGEAIPAAQAGQELARHCDLLLVIGTSGEVAPAS